MRPWRSRADRRRAPSRDRPRRTRPARRGARPGGHRLLRRRGEAAGSGRSTRSTAGREDPPEEALRRFAHHAEAWSPGRRPRMARAPSSASPHLPCTRAFAMRRRGSCSATQYHPVAFGRAEACGDRHRQTHRQDALAGHLARLLADDDPLIVCMGREGPRSGARRPDTTLDDTDRAGSLRRSRLLRTTSRTPCWPACAPSAAGASGAG